MTGHSAIAGETCRAMPHLIDTEVLIVGGGPVGLTLAMDLARRGVGVTLAEMRAAGEPPSSVRCNHVSARTMEIYRRLGVVHENAVLRHQLTVLRRKLQGRVRLTNTDRWVLIVLYRWFPSILQVLTIIRPETLIHWHRYGFRCYWRWKSRSLGGRPPIEASLRALIRQMSMDNPCMGLSLSSAKFATRYLSTCSGWFDVRGADLGTGLPRSSFLPFFLSSFLPFLHGPF
jgi:hypothetical protein